MLLGFISLLLTVGQGPISNICISKSVGASWHPCSKDEEKKLVDAEETDSEDSNRRKLLMVSHSGETFRRFLATASSNSTDTCVAKVCPGPHTHTPIHEYFYIYILLVCVCFFFLVKTAAAISHIRHMIMFFFP